MSPREDDPIPKFVYRRKPDGAPAGDAGPESPGILAAREEMRRAAAREEEAAKAKLLQDSPPRAAALPPKPRIRLSRTMLLIRALGVADILLSAACLLAMRHYSAARAWEESFSFDLGDEQATALAGLTFLVIAASVAAGGFFLSALGLFSRTRLGRRVALVWAGVCTLSIVGAIYGLPSLLILLSRDARERMS